MQTHIADVVPVREIVFQDITQPHISIVVNRAILWKVFINTTHLDAVALSFNISTCHIYLTKGSHGQRSRNNDSTILTSLFCEKRELTTEALGASHFEQTTIHLHDLPLHLAAIDSEIGVISKAVHIT